jgi:LacI family transcriptional regulator
MILNGRTDVSFSAATERRVLDAARKLGYKLPRRRTDTLWDGKTILVVCPNVTNPYYSSIVQAIQQAAHSRDLFALVCTTYRDMAVEERILRVAAASKAAGVIFAMMPQCGKLIENVAGALPVVVIGDRNASLSVDTVELDNFEAGALIARHMIGLGHRHAVYVTTTLNEANSARVRRVEGLVATWREACPEGSVLVRSRAVTPEEELMDIAIEHRVGQELAEECLADARLTAFVAVNDMVGYGVLDAILGAGFRVPQDYSVCGFDNIFPSNFKRVGLTTVEHYMEEKGRNAVEMLCSALGGSAPHNITRVEYKPLLVVRGSTAQPRQG